MSEEAMVTLIFNKKKYSSLKKTCLDNCGDQWNTKYNTRMQNNILGDANIEVAPNVGSEGLWEVDIFWFIHYKFTDVNKTDNKIRHSHSSTCNWFFH